MRTRTRGPREPDPPHHAAGDATHLQLGDRAYDLTDRGLVVGILNRTRDSFYDAGAYFELDALLRRAEQLVADGADVLEVGARPGGVGVRDVSVDEETELLTSTISAVAARFDVALSADTWRAPVVRAAFASGAVLANDMSGFADDDYLSAAAAAGAAVVATHIRLAPGVPDPEPVYDDVVDDVASALRELADRARRAGIPDDRIVVDPGLDLGKSWRQSLRLLANVNRFAALGHPVLVAASNKIFLGRALGLEPGERDAVTVAACSYGLMLGGRVLRVHDVRGARHAADLYAAMREADRE